MTDVVCSVPGGATPPGRGSSRPSATAAAPIEQARRGPSRLRFEDVYAGWFHEVCRWVRALGGRPADADDLTQDVFLVVRRKLATFDGANVGGWLYRITQRTVRDHRQAAWSRRFQCTEGQPLDVAARSPGPDPSQVLERRQSQQILCDLLGRMTQKRRSIFIQFEIEGYSGEEIAHREGIPVNTVWTRLHHARRDFTALLAEQRRDLQT